MIGPFGRFHLQFFHLLRVIRYWSNICTLSLLIVARTVRGLQKLHWICCYSIVLLPLAMGEHALEG